MLAGFQVRVHGDQLRSKIALDPQLPEVHGVTGKPDFTDLQGAQLRSKIALDLQLPRVTGFMGYQNSQRLHRSIQIQGNFGSELRGRGRRGSRVFMDPTDLHGYSWQF